MARIVGNAHAFIRVIRAICGPEFCGLKVGADGCGNPEREPGIVPVSA
jgi:hypothetical protein